MAKMLQFVDVDRQMPDKAAPEARRGAWDEIYAGFARDRASAQAERCSQCGIPFCQVHCPLHNNIPDWLLLTAEGRLEEAYEVVSATNTFPEVCGRICPQDRLCEGNCVIEQSGHGTVTIGAIENYITMTAFEQGWIKPIKPPFERSQSVGIIGAGPGGMAAADALRRQGYRIDIYDRHDRAGGLMIYGIPNFKLEKDTVLRRWRLLEEGGITFHLNCEVGRDVNLDELRSRHDAVLIATGVYKSRDMKVPGAGLDAIHPAMRYLTAANRVGLGDVVPEFDDGTLNAAGRDVVIVGGGDTAMDCVRTAVRQGATSVRCLYRRDRANMPGSMREVANAEEEGIEFVWRSAPEAFLGDTAVDGIRAVHMRLGAPDASGRRAPEPVEGSAKTMPADMVITALGFDPEDLPAMFAAPELTVSRWGTVRADLRTKATSLDGVFAAGDIVRGASLVVWAIRDGRDAATAIHRYMQENVVAEMSRAS